MTKPQRFISSTDYATLKNDATGTMSVTLPLSTVIAARSTYRASAYLTIGQAGSDVRSRISRSKDNIWYMSKSVAYLLLNGATILGSPTTYDLIVAINRTTPETLALHAFINNPYEDPITITGLSQTITAHVATFIPPAP